MDQYSIKKRVESGDFDSLSMHILAGCCTNFGQIRPNLKKLCAKLHGNDNVEVLRSVHSFNGLILNNQIESSPETSIVPQCMYWQDVVQILAKSNGNWRNTGKNSNGMPMLKCAIKSTHTMNWYSTTNQSRVPKLRQHLDACTGMLWSEFRLYPTEIKVTMRKTWSACPCWNAPFSPLNQWSDSQQQDRVESRNFDTISIHILSGCGANFG